MSRRECRECERRRLHATLVARGVVRDPNPILHVLHEAWLALTLHPHHDMKDAA